MFKILSHFYKVDIDVRNGIIINSIIFILIELDSFIGEIAPSTKRCLIDLSTKFP